MNKHEDFMLFLYSHKIFSEKINFYFSLNYQLIIFLIFYLYDIFITYNKKGCDFIMKKFLFCISLLMFLGLCSCGNLTITNQITTTLNPNFIPTPPPGGMIPGGSTNNTTVTLTPSTTAVDAMENYQEIDNGFIMTSSTNTGYTCSNNIYTITEAGEYTCSGKLDEGQIYVNAGTNDVVIILNGVSISSNINSPIFIEEANKVTVKAKIDTYNELYDNRELLTADITDEAIGLGCIYAKCDLDIQGKGSLCVYSTYNNGIHTKDDLSIKNLILKVKAPNNSLKGNDSVCIESGNLIVISTLGDGIKTSNSDISDKGNQRGNVEILGGNIDIYSANDGIDASYDINVSNDAVINIYTDSYSKYNGDTSIESNSSMYLRMSSNYYNQSYTYSVKFYNSDSDYVWVDASYDSMSTSNRPGGSSYYYYKLSIPTNYNNMMVAIFNNNPNENYDNYYATSSGGTINTSMDMYKITKISNGIISGDWTNYSNTTSTQTQTYSSKGLKAQNNIIISGATFTINSSDDSIHANSGIALENGNTSVGNVTITGGNITLSSNDDGIKADNILEISGGNINVVSAYEGLEGAIINISGGESYVYSTDDGLNAQTSINISGGYVDVTVGDGDTDGIDSNGGYTQSSGFVISKSNSTGMYSAFDTDGSVSITGGTLIAFGSISNLNSNINYVSIGSTGSSMGGGRPGISSSQTSSSIALGTYTISGTEIKFTLTKSYTGCIIASENLVLNTSYTLSNGSQTYSWTQSSKGVTAS